MGGIRESGDKLAMPKKREQWRLPKEFIPDSISDELRQRYDGEPCIYTLVKHGNDRTLVTDGLTHHRTFNVFKTPDGNWYLMIRSYSVPGTGLKEQQ